MGPASTHSLNLGELGELKTEVYRKGYLRRWGAPDGPPTIAGITTDGRDWTG